MTLRVSIVVSDCMHAADTITLDETSRHRRRLLMTSDNGITFLLDLPKARLLRQGDGLCLEDGRVIEVRAAPEALYEIKGESAAHLLTLAWHVGNRHLPAEIGADHLRIRRDHVIREMLVGLGASVSEVDEPFNPAGGAYDEAPHHGHS